MEVDRRKWEKMLTYFQAHARGHLVRKVVRGAQEDFEDIVKEIDGGLDHLKWRQAVISIPHFTDIDGPFLQPSSCASKHSDPVSSSSQSPAATTTTAAAAAPLSEDKEEAHHLLPQRIEAERDDSQSKSPTSISTECFTSSHCSEERGGQKVMENTGDSNTIWKSLELDMNYSRSHKGAQQYCSAQEVPRTPEALRLHRNTLTMELLWLQQAIESRKKYLSLKDTLSISS